MLHKALVNVQIMCTYLAVHWAALQAARVCGARCFNIGKYWQTHCSNATFLERLVWAQVLPEVYGGDAELVPVDEAALKHRMEQQQQRKQSKQAAKRKASTIEAVKSGRIASAGRVLSRWSSSAWSVAKKPAVVSHRCLALSASYQQAYYCSVVCSLSSAASERPMMWRIVIQSITGAEGFKRCTRSHLATGCLTGILAELVADRQCYGLMCGDCCADCMGASATLAAHAAHAFPALHQSGRPQQDVNADQDAVAALLPAPARLQHAPAAAAPGLGGRQGQPAPAAADAEPPVPHRSLPPPHHQRCAGAPPSSCRLYGLFSSVHHDGQVSVIACLAHS